MDQSDRDTEFFARLKKAVNYARLMRLGGGSCHVPRAIHLEFETLANRSLDECWPREKFMAAAKVVTIDELAISNDSPRNLPSLKRLFEDICLYTGRFNCEVYDYKKRLQQTIRRKHAAERSV